MYTNIDTYLAAELEYRRDRIAQDWAPRRRSRKTRESSTGRRQRIGRPGLTSGRGTVALAR